MTIEEISAKAATALAEEFEIDMTAITPEATIKDDLGLDSLDLVDVVVLVEEHFGVRLTSTDFVGMVTYKDFCELLNRKING